MKILLEFKYVHIFSLQVTITYYFNRYNNTQMKESSCCIEKFCTLTLHQLRYKNETHLWHIQTHLYITHCTKRDKYRKFVV